MSNWVVHIIGDKKRASVFASNTCRVAPHGGCSGVAHMYSTGKYELGPAPAPGVLKGGILEVRSARRALQPRSGRALRPRMIPMV